MDLWPFMVGELYKLTDRGWFFGKRPFWHNICYLQNVDYNNTTIMQQGNIGLLPRTSSPSSKSFSIQIMRFSCVRWSAMPSMQRRS